MAEAQVAVVPADRPPAALKTLAKQLMHLFATVLVLPWLVGYFFSKQLLGPHRALEGSSQALAGLPGIIGVYMRRAFLARVLGRCALSAEVHYGTLFSQAGTRLDENVYVGPRCQLGWVHLEADVLLAAGVHIPSGGRTHYFDDPTKPIREQGGERSMITIGRGAWIGNAAIILADVGPGTIVGAGSVVTKPLPENVIAAGVPARIIRSRFAPQVPADANYQDEGTSP